MKKQATHTKKEIKDISEPKPAPKPPAKKMPVVYLKPVSKSQIYLTVILLLVGICLIIVGAIPFRYFSRWRDIRKVIAETKKHPNYKYQMSIKNERTDSTETVSGSRSGDNLEFNINVSASYFPADSLYANIKIEGRKLAQDTPKLDRYFTRLRSSPQFKPDEPLDNIKTKYASVVPPLFDPISYLTGGISGKYIGKIKIDKSVCKFYRITKLDDSRQSQIAQGLNLLTSNDFFTPVDYVDIYLDGDYLVKKIEMTQKNQKIASVVVGFDYD